MNNTPRVPNRSARDRPLILGGPAMSRRFRSVLATTACLLAALDASAYQNEPTGFRGMPWGTPLAAVQFQFVLLKSGKYAKVQENLSFGEVHLQRIEYGFEDGRFDAVELYPERGLLEGARLLADLKAKFGKPSMVLDDGSSFWVGNTINIAWSCANAQCWALIGRQHASDSANTPKKSDEGLAMVSWQSCQHHCTTMHIICKMGTTETYGGYVPPSERCDDNLAMCKSDCDGELHRRQYENRRVK
jgi:hypothetical protein